MGTSYYRLKDPFTAFRVETIDGLDRVSLWARGEPVGVLEVPAGCGAQVVSTLIDRDVGVAPLHTHWGGEVGSVVTENEPGLPDDMVLVSEYGDVLTVGEVRRRAGAKRKDGWPTELRGYERPGGGA
jgi:hypothetical protein